MSSSDHVQNGKLIVPPDRARQVGSVIEAARSPVRPVLHLQSNILMVFVVAAGMVGLIWFAGQVSTQSPGLTGADQVGSGIIVRSELHDIWLPAPFTDSSQEAVKTYEELQRFLDSRCERGLWYAVTIRGHLAGGSFEDITFVRQPYQQPGLFPEFTGILAIARRALSGEIDDDFSVASVHILAEECVAREPREAMAELLGHPHAGVDSECAHAGAGYERAASSITPFVPIPSSGSRLVLAHISGNLKRVESTTSRIQDSSATVGTHMMYRSVLKNIASILTVGIGTMVAHGAEPPKTTTEQDIVYTKAGSVELKLDLARPAEGNGPFPAVIVIHGGAWRQGNKADVRPILPQFAQRGYVAISPQYRFCPKDAVPRADS